MRDGLLGGAGAVFVVADDAAQQAIVGGGNVVVVVEQQGCECGGIDSEFVSVVHTFCQSRVERVNAFEDEDVVLLEFQFPSARNAFPGEEVIARRFNLFSGDEGVELGGEEFDVHCFDVFEVIFSFLIARCAYAVHKVVVGGDCHGAYAADSELDSESFGEGGFPAGGRSGDEHDFHVGA